MWKQQTLTVISAFCYHRGRVWDRQPLHCIRSVSFGPSEVTDLSPPRSFMNRTSDLSTRTNSCVICCGTVCSQDLTSLQHTCSHKGSTAIIFNHKGLRLCIYTHRPMLMPTYGHHISILGLMIENLFAVEYLNWIKIMHRRKASCKNFSQKRTYCEAPLRVSPKLVQKQIPAELPSVPPTHFTTEDADIWWQSFDMRMGDVGGLSLKPRPFMLT